MIIVVKKKQISAAKISEKRRLGTGYAPEITKNAALAQIFASANWHAAMGEMRFSVGHYLET